MNSSAYRMRLSAAIQAQHGAHARWINAVPVSEGSKGLPVWTGDVEVFELIKHATAKYCYAWAIDVKEGSEIIMVLKIPPVDSPQAAVREALGSGKVHFS